MVAFSSFFYYCEAAEFECYFLRKEIIKEIFMNTNISMDQDLKTLVSEARQKGLHLYG